MKVITRGEVFVDMCPSCRGVWLDGGELEKILADTRAHEAERLRDERAADGGAELRTAGRDDVERPGRSDRDRERDGDRGKKKRKSSWFSNLGDLLEDVFD
jgi:Zn-finger nucleic acid-binding protein